ncbi:MAG: hypothetical protein WDO14_08890 [Bacteroidota bacterium]
MTLTLETISQFLSTRFPALVLTVLVAAFIWFAQSTNHRLERIEDKVLPDERARIYNLELERVKAEATDRQLEKDRDEMRQDIKEIREDIAEIKADLRVLMPKLK